METRSQAAAIVKRAEGEIRELLLRAASEGDYEHVAVLAEWAQRLRQLTEQAGTAKGTTGALSGINGHADKSKAKKADYPRFHRERNELVKIGWSKKQKAEYRHKAPKAVVLLVAQALQQKGAGGERFTFEELLPFRDRGTGADVPSYQAYLALAWLRHENLIVQHGRQGYSLPANNNLMDAVEDRWKLLPKA
jgi:hypothetical protein